MSPVGFYKKGGKTRPITKAKPRKTLVIKRARIAKVNRGGYDHDGTWIPDANDVIIECAEGTANGVVSSSRLVVIFTISRPPQEAVA